MTKLARTCGIHDGTFHADEVVACVLLSLFNQIDESKIIRTRDSGVLDRCEFVCDVGGIYDPENKRFDHHQLEYEGLFSSAGMILEFLRDQEIVTEKLYKYLNENIILGVDAHDNGKSTAQFGTFHFSNCVSSFNPIDHGASMEKKNKQFKEAFYFAKLIFSRLVERFEYNEECLEKVKKAMAECTDCLIFEESLSWQECFFELGGEDHPALFIIMPADQYWKLRAVPPSMKNRMLMRKALPKKWAGLSDRELEEVSGIQGARFCHKGRFISIWETKEAAIKAMKKVLKRENS